MISLERNQLIDSVVKQLEKYKAKEKIDLIHLRDSLNTVVEEIQDSPEFLAQLRKKATKDS